jgi:hypothetical protein
MYSSVYDSRDSASRLTPTPSPFPRSSVTYVHRCIGYRNPTNRHFIPTSVRMMYLCVYDSRDRSSESVPSPSPRSSLTYVQRCIGYHHPTISHFMSTSVRLMYLSMSDIRVSFTPSPLPSTLSTSPAQPSARETSISSSVSSSSFITPTPSVSFPPRIRFIRYNKQQTLSKKKTQRLWKTCPFGYRNWIRTVTCFCITFYVCFNTLLHFPCHPIEQIFRMVRVIKNVFDSVSLD